MGRPQKGLRLHKFSHRPNWYVRGAGVPDRSAGTPCLGAAVTHLRSVQLSTAAAEASAVIDSDPAMMTAVRKVVRKSKERAKLKGMDFDLTEHWVLQAIKRQEGRCALSGLPFSVGGSSAGRRQPFAPSADRIENCRGYTPDNVRIVCVMVNLARGDFSDAEFLKMCRAVSGNMATQPRPTPSACMQGGAL